MIYLLYGSNFSKSRAKLREIITSQIKKNTDASYFKLNSDNWEEGKFQGFIGGKGLFQNKYIVVLDGLVGNRETQEQVLNSLDDIKDSENIFVIIEENLTKETIKKIEKRAEKVQNFHLEAQLPSGSLASKNKEFNIFSLTDALGKRDKKQLWVLYQKALFSGAIPEEIHRILFWQVKATLSAVVSRNANEAGLNPFVYKKSLGFAKNFSKKELNDLSSRLVSIYHDTRRGMTDFDVALERFVLGI